MKMEMVDHNFVVDHRSELVVATSGRAIPALFGSYLIFVSDRLAGVDGLGVPGVPRHHVHVPGHHDRPHQVVGRHLKCWDDRNIFCNLFENIIQYRICSCRKNLNQGRKVMSRQTFAAVSGTRCTFQIGLLVLFTSADRALVF